MTDANPQSIRQTALFQLNLMLWMVWSSAPFEVTGIRPVFREDGFRLQAIGGPLQVPFQVVAIAKRDNIPIQGQASPDILLRHDGYQLLVPIECKVSSFDSSNEKSSPQANALLTY